jgi:hypothetical protein
LNAPDSITRKHLKYTISSLLSDKRPLNILPSPLSLFVTILETLTKILIIYK